MLTCCACAAAADWEKIACAAAADCDACTCCVVLLSVVTSPLSWATALFQPLTLAWLQVTGWMDPSFWGTFRVTAEPLIAPYHVAVPIFTVIPPEPLVVPLRSSLARVHLLLRRGSRNRRVLVGAREVPIG